MIARALKIDPLEFRRRNIMHEGGKHTTGTPLEDAQLDEVLDRVAERMSWGKPFDRGDGHGQARPRARHRHQGGDLADHLGRDRQRQCRRQHHALLRHHRHGPGLRHRDGADGRRNPQHPGRGGERGAARHRRDALRHGHARLALAVPHGPCGAPRRRGGARQDRRDGARPRAAGGHQLLGRRPVPEEVRHAGRQHRRHRRLQAGLRPAAARHRPDHQCDAVLDGVGRRRRGRGRYRDRACPHHQAHQRLRRRQADQPEDLRDRRSPARR